MMKPKVIKTDAEYQQTLEQIEQLYNAKPGTEAGDSLELLLTLVDLYEEKTYPIELPDPLSAIKFRMEQQGLIAKDLIPYMGSAGKVSEVLSGKRSISMAMMRKLHLGLGIPAEVFLQASHEATRTALAAEADFRMFPVSEMVKRGWFADFSGSVREAKLNLGELMSTFLGPLGVENFSPALNRQGVHLINTYDPHAIAAWRIRIITLALSEKLPPYDARQLDAGFFNELVNLSYLSNGPLSAQEFLNKAGIHLIIEKHLPKTRLDGAAIMLSDGSPLVALTLRYDRLDSFWFTLLHELAHVVLHLNIENHEFLDELSEEDGGRCEEEANQFARDHLIPPEQWDPELIQESIPTVRAVESFAAALRISPAIPAGRIRYELKNFSLYDGLLGRGKVRTLFST